MENIKNNISVTSGKNTIQVEIIRDLDDNPICWILRNYLNDPDQNDLNNYICFDLPTRILDCDMDSTNNPIPIVFDNLVYTGTSNCAKPKRLYQLADNCWNLLKSSPKCNFSEEKPNFDSVYAQSYDAGCIMKDHKDQYVDWGVSLNLGSSCQFNFNGSTIYLNSGDVVVADFSKYVHGVPKILAHTRPYWWQNNSFSERISVQIRDTSKSTCEHVNEREFFKLINA